MKKSLANSKRLLISPDQYNQLIFIDKNRCIKKAHVKTMTESVLKHGCLRLVVVVWDEILEKYIVVDGQHLTRALQGLNRNIECHVVDCDDDKHLTQLMIDLNNVSKSWTYNDYIHGWAESGNKSYKILANELKKSNLQLSIVLMAYTQKRRCIATKMMKEGTFEITDKTYGDKLISQIKDCNNYVPNSRAVNEALINLMVSVEVYDHKKMLKNLKSEMKHVILDKNETKLYNQLVLIYKGL